MLHDVHFCSIARCSVVLLTALTSSTTIIVRPTVLNMVNLVTVLNNELDHALDELGKVQAEVAELHDERATCHYQNGGSPAPVGILHPYRSPPRGRFDYGTPECRTQIDLDP
jgi:hypothetical protein